MADVSPKVGIVIVNWNRKDDVLRCIDSVFESDYGNYELLIIDNNSTDSSVDAIQIRHPEIEIIKIPKNIGFTGGSNTGIQELIKRDAEYIFLLNNDAIIETSTLSNLVSTATSHPEAGFYGAKIYIRQNRRMILSAGGILVNGWKPVQRGIGELDQGQFDQLEEVDYLSGCALLVSREVINKIGLLDEDFFAYNEDIEWCHRGKQANFQVLFVPQAKVWHPDTRLRDENSPFVTYYINRNILLFAKKYHLGAKIEIQILGSFLRTLLSWSIRPKWKHKKQQRDALWLAVRDYFSGHYGEMGEQVKKVCFKNPGGLHSERTTS